MEDSTVTAGDMGQTGPESGALDTPSIATPALILPSLPLSAPPLPSSQPPSRPCRPKPLPATVKPSLLPPRPPLPPSTPPSLPPPLPPVSKPSAPLFPNNPPPTLPPPLSPTPVSPTPSPLLTTATPAPVFSDSTPSLPPPLNPTVSSPSTLPPSPLPLSSPACPALSPTDRLVETTSVWKPKGLSKTQTRSILEKETTGAFMVHGTEDGATELSVRLPDQNGVPLVQNLAVKQHKTFLHLDGSTLVFDDIVKLVSFYCVSRDILPVPLRLPQVVTMATKKEELEVVSVLGAEFWTSDLNQQAKNQDLVLDPDHKGQSSLYVYINPVPVEEDTSKEPQQPAVINVDISSSLQNGEKPVKVSPEVKGRSISHQETPLNKYKRPPPRPPSLGSASGMGLLFSSSSLVQNSSSLAVEKKEEGKGVGGDTEERKTTSTSPPPLRPPVPAQSRAAPRLPPAPLRRNSSHKSTDRERAEATEGEKGHNSAREGTGARAEETTGSQSAPACETDGKDSHQGEEEEVKRDRRQAEKEVKDEKEVIIDPEGNEDKQKPSIQTQPLVKRPSRPVPPPRRKPCSPEAPVCPSQAAGGPASQKAGTRVPPPSPARRPDVSLYSPQGGAALGTDPDSCSASSTEDEGELNQEQVQNHNHCAGSRSPKSAVKRTSTTVILDRARYRLSTVLTGLISHDRRLTQRIVELARDPASYFGNLVKEHRAFTLDTMSHHSSSTELLQEIRQMMTQLKSYLLQSTELQVMLEPQHQYAQDKLESIVEAALCKSVLKPLREPIYRSLEKLHENDNSLKKLTQNQSVVLGSTTTALGVTTAVPEAPAMEKISIKLSNLHLDYSPQKKIELLLKACKIIYDSMSVSCPGRAHGADDLLPVMMYVLARSNLAALQLDVEYMMELMDPSLTLGEGSYYLTTTYGALEHIKSFDQQRAATRQLSREVQDSIHRWERRRTLNQERMAQGSVRDFLTVCCPEMGINPKTLGVLPTTTVQQLSDQCAARFEQDSYTLSVDTDGVRQPLALTDLALSVKNSLQPGAYCFVYHPDNQGDDPRCHGGAWDPPPGQPAESCCGADAAAADSTAAEAEEESLISL